MSNPPHSNSIKSQKPQSERRKTAAQRASEANTLQQRAVFTNSPRPGDRQTVHTPADDSKR